MTDWPDDWFRDAGGGAGGAGGAAGAGAQPAGAETPTVRGAAGAADPISPGGYQPSADQLTQPNARSSYYPGQPAAPGGNAGGGWPMQPAIQTADRPPRAWLGRPGLPGWRRFLRPRPIALAL